MNTFIIMVVAALGILVLLGAAITFAYLCAMLAGGVLGWALGVKDERQ